MQKQAKKGRSLKPRSSLEPAFVAHIVTGVRVVGGTDGKVYVMEDMFFIDAPTEEKAREKASSIVVDLKRRGLPLRGAYGPDSDCLGIAELVDIGLRRLIECRDYKVDQESVMELTYQKMTFRSVDEFRSFLEGSDVTDVSLYE
jgi:hypothetical protein